MRFKGVRIDVDAAKKFGERLNKSKNSIIDYIARRTNVRIEIWAASSIKKLLDNSIDIGQGPVRRGDGDSVYFQDLDCNHLEIHCDGK